ncbi:MAG: ABC transporter ATP-binding protein, partial [Burkholderiales bacterium]
YREKMGIQFQSTALPDFLTVREVLSLFGSFYPKSLDVKEVIRLCALEEFLDRDTHKLSGGQRQRVLLGIALVNDPEMIFLDEPTTGLDPQARRNFWEMIRIIKARGKTIVLTTHYMEEAYVLCDEIAIMDRGKIIAQGVPDQLLKKHFDGVTFEIPEQDFGSAPPNLPGKLKTADGLVTIRTTQVNETVRALLDRGVPLAHLKIRSQTLEDLFLELTGKALREG